MRSDRVSRADRRGFLEWLNENPAHSAAYGECQAAWEMVGAAAGDEEIVRMRRDSLALAPKRPFLSWRGAAALAAALAVFLFAGLAFVANDVPLADQPTAVFAEAAAPKTLHTSVGERSAVTLEDGSIVELNTDSLALVSYAGDRREVRLVRGQALFDVAHDPGRPFVVEAAGKRVVALGTVFDVRVESDQMMVTLIEGRVRVEPAGRADEATAAAVRILQPGEQLVAHAGEPAVVLPADVQKQVGWRTGRLVFSDEPLGQVVAEINRYSARKVVLADAGLAELRVSGVFRVGSMPGFVAALDAGFPVDAENRRNEVILRWEGSASGPTGQP